MSLPRANTAQSASAPLNASGYFIAFEGGDGVGKSTQVHALARALKQAQSRPVTVTREPGGTPLAEQIRRLLLTASPDPGCTPDDLTEAYLFAAARAHHVSQLIRPARDAGHVVITDRFVGSSVAYQGAGRGLGEDLVTELNRLAVSEVIPDLTIVLDLDPHVAADRRITRSQAAPDRMEANDEAFHTALRDSFLNQAAHAPNRHLVLDATLPADELTQQIYTRVMSELMP